MADENDEGRKLSAIDATKGGHLSFAHLIKGAAAGMISIDKKYTASEIEELVKGLDALSGVSHAYEETGYSQDINIVYFQFPGKPNLWYVTLMRGGKLILSKDEEGHIDTSNVMVGFNEHVVDMMASASMTLGDEVERKKREGTGKGKADKGKSAKNGGDKPKPAHTPTKAKPGYVRDPCIDRFLEENARSLAHADLRGNLVLKKQRPITGDNLDKVIEDADLLEKLKLGAAEIKAEPITSYLANHMRQIHARVKSIVGQIIDKPEVRRTAGTLINEYSPKGDYELGELRTLCASDDAVFDLYRNLRKARDRQGMPDPVECYLICFRELAMKKLHAAASAEKIDACEFEKAKTVTAGWVGRAKAADEVQADKYIQEEIIPMIRERGADENARDKIFDAVCELGKRVIDPNHLYGVHHFRYLVDGLWMEGVMEKDVGGEVVPRTPGGALVEYTDGISNLLERYEIYDGLLRQGFHRLLNRGQFDQKWRGLDTQARCSSFGKTLYLALHDSERARFTRIKGDELPLRPDGTYLARILRAYVGMNRDYFRQEVEKRRRHHGRR